MQVVPFARAKKKLFAQPARAVLHRHAAPRFRQFQFIEAHSLLRSTPVREQGI
jgi:hypothetical protein